MYKKHKEIRSYRTSTDFHLILLLLDLLDYKIIIRIISKIFLKNKNHSDIDKKGFWKNLPNFAADCQNFHRKLILDNELLKVF